MIRTMFAHVGRLRAPAPVVALPPKPAHGPPRTLALAALVLAGVGGSLQEARAAALPILIDGYFDEWVSGPLHVDPEGDTGTSGIDFRNLYVAEDQEWLFIRFDTTEEIPLYDDTNIAIYLDTDADAGTGVQVGGLGAELRWRFGLRSGTFYGSPPPVNIDWNDIRLRAGPNTTSTDWEIAIGRDVQPGGSTPLFTGNHIRILLRDEDGTGDRIPDDGEFIDYFFTNEGLPPVPPNDLTKDAPGHVRLVTMNVHFDSPWDPGQDERYDRIFSAIDPQIIAFQEIFQHGAAQTRVLVEGWLPSGPDEQWYAFGVDDCITVSRYPFVGLWSIGNNFAGLLETTDDLGHQTLVINTHLPCCDNDAGRQEEADAIMAFIRDAQQPGVGSVDLAEDTIIMITGDMNLVGSAQQLRTLRDGDIVNQGVHGPAFDPDWDGTPLTDLASPQTEVRMPYTWRNDQASNLPGRIDMWLYTDSVIDIGNHFTLYTPNMSSDQLLIHGLEEDDSPEASDHIPHVTDIYASGVGVAQVSAAGSRDIAVAPNPMQVGTVFSMTLEAHRDLTVEVFDVSGRRVRSLVTGDASGEAGIYAFSWDGGGEAGEPVASGTYYVRVSGITTDGRGFTRRTTVTLLR